MAVNVMEEYPPLQPTPRRAELVSAKKNMQAIKSIVQPMTKYAWCMAPGTLWQSVKNSGNIPRSMMCSGHISRKKPALTAEKIVLRPSSLTARCKLIMLLSSRGSSYPVVTH